MKTPIRFQSQLLIRRSYKPARNQRRALGITFRAARPFWVQVAERKSQDPSASVRTDANAPPS